MKKFRILFAIVIATLSFTACNDGTTTVPAPTIMAATDGPGIDIPADSVEYAYQYPVLGKWLDCNLNYKGLKKVTGYFTKKVMVPIPAKHIDGSIVTASGEYAHVGDKGVVVDKTTLKNTASVTIDDNGAVTTEASSDVDPEKVKQSVTQSGFAGISDSSFFGFPLLNWLIGIALILSIIWLFLSLKDRNKNQSSANPAGGTSNGQAAVITVGNNAGAKINVANGVTTITHNT